MMVKVLLQLDALPELRRAIRDEFQTGGSILGVLLALLGLAAVVLLAYLLAELQRKRAVGPAKNDDPERLYRDLLGKLGLATDERQVLDTLAREMRLKHPAVILLSEALFDRHVAGWRARWDRPPVKGGPAPDGDTIARVRTRLFGRGPVGDPTDGSPGDAKRSS